METLKSAVGGELHTKRYWWVFLVTGIFWLILSLVLLRFNPTSAVTIGLMAGVMTLLAAANEFVTAIWNKEWRWLRLVLGVLFVVVGVVCLSYPGKTFEIVAAVFAWYLLFRGFFDFAKALAYTQEMEAWWVLLIVGLVEMGLGFWAAGYYAGSAVVLIAIVGIGALVRGIGEIIDAFRLRKLPEPEV